MSFSLFGFHFHLNCNVLTHQATPPSVKLNIFVNKKEAEHFLDNMTVITAIIVQK